MSDNNRAFSFEYFPPKTDAGRDKLLAETTPALQALDPEFFSVTYGAGGSTRDNTRDIVAAIRAQGIDVAPHLSFGGDDEQAIGDAAGRLSRTWRQPTGRAARRHSLGHGWRRPTGLRQ